MASLREKSRLANIGGDIFTKLKHKQVQEDVQRDLARKTDTALKKSEKGDTLGNIFDAIKIASTFTPWGAGINTILSVADIVKDVGHGINIPKIKIPSKYKGTPYEQFYKQNIQGLNEQIKGARKGKMTGSLLSNLLNIGGAKIFSDAGKLELFKKGGADTSILKNLVTGSSEDSSGTNILGKTLSKIFPGAETVTDLGNKRLFKTPEGAVPNLWGNPQLSQLFTAAASPVSRIFRGKTTPTSPMAPTIQGPSVRRGIR